MRYIILMIAFIAVSCGSKKGCLNQFSSNYDFEAMVDCCCEFDVALIIEDIVGTHTVRGLCSGNSDVYSVEISKDPSNSSGIIISNFHNEAIPLKATWSEEGEFRLQKEWQSRNCDVTVTGSLHKNNGKLHFIYAAIPSNECDNFNSVTCETRGL